MAGKNASVTRMARPFRVNTDRRAHCACGTTTNAGCCLRTRQNANGLRFTLASANRAAPNGRLPNRPNPPQAPRKLVRGNTLRANTSGVSPSCSHTSRISAVCPRRSPSKAASSGIGQAICCRTPRTAKCMHAACNRRVNEPSSISQGRYAPLLGGRGSQYLSVRDVSLSFTRELCHSARVPLIGYPHYSDRLISRL